MVYPRQQSPEAWAQQLNFAAIERQHGLPAGVLTNLVRQESHGNCDAKSPAGACGLVQMMPGTARELGVNAGDPVSSINGAARYLERLTDYFNGDTSKAIAAYNCGPGNVNKAIRKGGEANWRSFLPNETKHYLEVVGSGISGKTYAQRLASGEKISDADEKAEEERRKKEAEELGVNPAIFGDGIMGKIFFAILKPFLEKLFEKMGLPKDDGLAASTPQQGQHVADGATVAPTAGLPLRVAAAKAPGRQTT